MKYKFNCCHFLCRLLFLNNPTYISTYPIYTVISHMKSVLLPSFTPYASVTPQWHASSNSVNCTMHLSFWVLLKVSETEVLAFSTLGLIVISGLRMKYLQKDTFQKQNTYLLTKSDLNRNSSFGLSHAISYYKPIPG